MRYPKKKPIQCSVAWWQGKGHYCYNTQQKLGDDMHPNNPKCIACRAHYSRLNDPWRDVLKPGWENIGYQLGTGIDHGWHRARWWLKEITEEDLNWKESGYLCHTCGKPLQIASVPAPFPLRLWRCEDGHKFSYQNTE